MTGRSGSDGIVDTISDQLTAGINAQMERFSFLCVDEVYIQFSKKHIMTGCIVNESCKQSELTTNRYFPFWLNSWTLQLLLSPVAGQVVTANEWLAKTNWLSSGWPSIDLRVPCP